MRIKEAGGCLLRRMGRAAQILQQIKEEQGNFILLSHEETGNLWSYARDLEVKAWCQATNIKWLEFPNNAVVRRLKSRDDWAAHWHTRIEQKPTRFAGVRAWVNLRSEPSLTMPMFGHDRVANSPPHALEQRGGRSEGRDILRSFLQERGEHYRYRMSSPLTADTACSRISPYLTWGCLSLREVVHATNTRLKTLATGSKKDESFIASLRAFKGRLHWHCHFIQKLEDEPQIEVRNVHAGFDGLRTEALLLSDLAIDEQGKLAAWCSGQTGYPFIDACMRSLNATGWINYRMRAMLHSFASYQLWLHWRLPGEHLARQFTDYEPGIHWAQCQMQSGVTGINTIRMYCPVKQGKDQDPQALFIKRWLPELRTLTAEEIHLGVGLHDRANYPKPVVNLAEATLAAKRLIYARKADEAVRSGAQQVFQKHGSRTFKRERQRKAQKVKPIAADPQLSLFV